MGARTTAREAALQMLYAFESSDEPLEHVIRQFWRETPGDAEGRPYADATVRELTAKLASVDERVGAASDNWRLERMARVDRNVLRLGAFELEFRPELPRAVIIDEAVELAKRFGSEDSGKFVNGVLERLANDLGRRDPDEAPRPA